MALAALVVVRGRVVAGRPGGLEESRLDVVVGPGHAAVLAALVLAPAARRLVDRHVEVAARAGDAAQEARARREGDDVLQKRGVSNSVGTDWVGGR